MPQPSVAVIALLSSQETERPTKRYLGEVTPSSYPVICLVEDGTLSSRDRERIARTDFAVLLSPLASVVAGWLDEITAVAKDHPDAVIVPISPNVNGPQRTILEEGQSVRHLKDQAIYASEMRRVFHGLTQPIAFATDLVACAPSAWVVAALTASSSNDSLDLFSGLFRSRPLLLAQGAAVFASQVKTRLIPGARPKAPLVSLCMIVKDEEVLLPEALESARDLADEIIVYDTGSTDRTREIAKAYGAIVIEGEWRDDFAWARNQTLEFASGAWILWIDADERVRGDVQALRVRLEDPYAPYESYSVRIENITGGGLTTTEHHANRLFRRKDCYWRGAIHETVWNRDNRRTCFAARVDEFHLEHLGYLDATLAEKKKADRNIHIAERNSSAASPEEVALHEARSLTMAGRFGEAVETIETKVLTGNAPAMERIATLALGSWLRVLGRMDEACAVVERYEALGFAPEFTANERALLAFDEGKWEEALTYANEVTRVVVDRDGLTVTPDALIGLRARALSHLERHDEAARVVIEGISRGVMDMHLNELLSSMEQGDVEIAELVNALPSDKKPLIIAQLLQIEPTKADAVLVAMHECSPSDRTILAAASLVSHRLDPQRRGYWNAILDKEGLLVSSRLT